MDLVTTGKIIEDEFRILLGLHWLKGKDAPKLRKSINNKMGISLQVYVLSWSHVMVSSSSPAWQKV